ncbi:hypothetical protein LX80_01952 [Hydrotalea sandarakina]|jgi:hypothetical protein|uniref:Uncharacterized protein n=1 Tax=Hydrotalea sandarakina TaxID=1004304 RepID=A0A2W7RNC9_9BACT|nr:hypothetical protein LX80_01952 [Hydrotalea sandarakina]
MRNGAALFYYVRSFLRLKKIEWKIFKWLHVTKVILLSAHSKNQI